MGWSENPEWMNPHLEELDEEAPENDYGGPDFTWGICRAGDFPLLMMTRGAALAAVKARGPIFLLVKVYEGHETVGADHMAVLHPEKIVPCFRTGKEIPPGWRRSQAWSGSRLVDYRSRIDIRYARDYVPMKEA